MSVNPNVVTFGIGPGSDISHLTLMGLEINPVFYAGLGFYQDRRLPSAAASLAPSVVAARVHRFARAPSVIAPISTRVTRGNR